MTNMKRFILAGLALLNLGLAAEAQTFHSLNFLNPVTSLSVSNLVQYTNLLTTTASTTGASTTNIVGLTYTNLLGNQVVVAAGDSTQLTVDIPLWVDRNGQPIINASGSNTVYSGAISGMTLNIHSSNAGSGAGTACTFVFVPVWDGVHETTASGDAWNIAFTPVASSPSNLATNVPIWKWPGAKSLRLRTINNGSTSGSSQVVFDSITLNGFVP